MAQEIVSMFGIDGSRNRVRVWHGMAYGVEHLVQNCFQDINF